MDAAMMAAQAADSVLLNCKCIASVFECNGFGVPTVDAYGNPS
jgi:hypothetical protein